MLLKTSKPRIRNSTVLKHEGILCTRKFGNPKAVVFGKEPRSCLYKEVLSSKKQVPGPGHHNPNILAVK